jgi:ribosomal protein S12 methylthiotransferase accessory factor YcaO
MVSALTGPVVSLTQSEANAAFTVIARGVAVDLAHHATRRIGGQACRGSNTEASELALSEFAERMAMSEPPFPPNSGECPLVGHMVEATELATGRRLRAPAADYYLHPETCEYNARPDRPTTSGAAAGSDYWSATARGLLELLERDALMLTWRWNMRRPGWHQYTDLSYIHGVPTLVCQLSGAVGSAADRTLRCAARRASAEARAVRDWLSGEQPQDSIAAFTDHALYYLHSSRREQLRRLLPDGTDRAPVADLPRDARRLVGLLAGRLASRGIQVYAADISAPWMLSSGLHVVVTRSPQLYPLELGFGSAAVAERLRWRAETTGPPLLDPVPLA